jgi:hypothetical protein
MTTFVKKQVNGNEELTIVTIENDTIQIRYPSGAMVITLEELEKALALHQSKIITIKNN